MESNSRRRFFGKAASMVAAAMAGTKLFAQQAPAAAAPGAPAGERPRRFGNRIHNGIYYFSGTGSNDGFGKEDHITVTDPFEKHVTRSMDALKKSLERAGSNMDSILNMQVFICLPHADSMPMPTGSAKFASYKEHYEALNKIYGTYFSPGKAPSRAFMAVEWIPGDSLVELVGSALVVDPSAAPAAPAAPAAARPPAGL
ncbi:MAG: RidA family protein [Acidobacteria bacterium]|nr:RidA family protein [Acidobacteriota bacterium]